MFMKKYLLIVLVTTFIVPSVALASWWNPFSWGWFHKTEKVKTIQTSLPNINGIASTTKIFKETVVATTSKPKLDNSVKITPSTTTNIKSNEVVLDKESKDICNQIGVKSVDTTKKSLLNDIALLCKNLQKGQYKEEAYNLATINLKDKWSLWTKTQEIEKSAQDRTLEIESQKKAELPIDETYVYHDYYPIILSLADNQGTIIKNSGYNNYKGYYSKPFTTNSLKIGDKINIKVEAKDPKSRPLLYLWDSTNADFRHKFNDTEKGKTGNWTSNNEINYTISQETIKNSGEVFRIVVYIKTEKENFRNASSRSNYYDDEIFIDYNLTIPTVTQLAPAYVMPDKPIIESFCDNRGNCACSSFDKSNSNCSASSNNTVHVGETINFTIKVSGEETSGILAFILPQEYDWVKEGGMKPWGSDLTYTKTFTTEDISARYFMYAYIKSSNDNYHRRSSGCNWSAYSCDDNTQIIYTVLP